MLSDRLTELLAVRPSRDREVVTIRATLNAESPSFRDILGDGGETRTTGKLRHGPANRCCSVDRLRTLR